MKVSPEPNLRHVPFPLLPYGQLLQLSPLTADPKRDALGYLPFAHLFCANYKC